MYQTFASQNTQNVFLAHLASAAGVTLPMLMITKNWGLPSVFFSEKWRFFIFFGHLDEISAYFLGFG